MAQDILAILQDQALRAKLPAGMRNNNPGNIKYVGQKVPGIVGPSVNTDQGDPQAVFDSPESGMAAMYRLLGKKYSGGKTTANKIIAEQMGWTPGNFEAAANVARYAGIGPDDDIGLTDPRRAATFMRALMRQEHGNSSSLYTDDMISRAVGGAPLPVGSTPAQSPYAGMADGRKGQEAYSQPVLGSMMAGMPSTQPSQSPQQPQTTGPIPAAAQALANPKASANNIFGMMAAMPQQQAQFSPVQIMGPSEGQATALSSLIAALKNRTA